MRCNMFSSAACAFVAVFALSSVYGQQPTVTQMQAKIQPQSKKLSIDEDAVILFFDEPEEHFVKARNSFARKDTKDASREIRKAIAFLKIESLRAIDDNEKALRALVQETEKLVNDMDKSTISLSIRKVAESLKQESIKASGDSAKALHISSEELQKLADQMEETAPQTSSNNVIDPLVARIHIALAKHHLVKSRDLFGKRDTKRSGNDLDAAAEHLARAYQWANKEADGGAKAVFKETRTLALRLNQGAAVSADEITKSADTMTKEIERVGKMADPVKK